MNVSTKINFSGKSPFPFPTFGQVIASINPPEPIIDQTPPPAEPAEDKQAETPVYDQPNHRWYGASRRLFLVLSQISGNLRAMEDYLEEEHGVSWTHEFVKLLDAGHDEAWACRKIIRDWFV